MLAKIDQLCQSKGITVAELAKKCGISRSYLSLVINGKRKNVNIEILERISKELDISISDLFVANNELVQDEDSIEAVMKHWQVSIDQRLMFKAFLGQNTWKTQEVIEEIFLDYESWLKLKKLYVDSQNTLDLIIASALLGGRIESSIIETLSNQNNLDLSSFFKLNLDNTIELKYKPSLVLEAYKKEVPKILIRLLNFYKTKDTSSQALLKIANICRTSGFKEFSLEYYAEAILLFMVEENMEIISQSIGYLQELPDTDLRKIVLAWHGGVDLSRQGKYNHALKTLLSIQPIKVAKDIERKYKSRIESTIGALYMTGGDYKQAIQHYRKSLLLWSEGALSGMTFVNLGTLLRRIGRLRQAKNTYQKALEFHEPFVKISALSSLAQIALDQGNLDETRRYLILGRKIARQSDLNTGKGDLYINLGAFYKAKSQYKRAEKLLYKGQSYAIESKDRRAIYYAHLELADLFITMGNLKEAETFVNMLTEEISSREEALVVGFWLNIKANLYFTQNKSQTSLLYLKKAYTLLSSQANVSREMEKCLKLLEQVYQSLCEPYQATLYRQERMRINRKINHSF